MQIKIKNYYQNIPWKNFRDIRFFGLIVFLIVVLLVTWSGAKAVQSNYVLQKQVSQLQAETQVKQLENNNSQLENQYYNTNQYLELSARQNFGLAAPGETELIVPQSAALKHLVNLQSSTSTSKTTTTQSAWQRNVEAWANFFLHRQSTSN